MPNHIQVGDVRHKVHSPSIEGNTEEEKNSYVVFELKISADQLGDGGEAGGIATPHHLSTAGFWTDI
jgi:hypothetical protein